MKKISFSLCFLLCFALFTGCNRAKKEKPEKISIKSGNYQSGKPGAKLKKTLAVEVLGPEPRGILGGKGKRHGVGNVKVFFKALNPSPGFKLSHKEVVTDQGGVAKTFVKLGNDVRDHYIEAYFKTEKGKKKVTFKVTSGVITFENNQEGGTENKLDKPFKIKLFKKDGSPAAPGIKVFFRIEGNGNGAKLDEYQTYTDKNGEAKTTLKLGKKTGLYFVSVEVSDDKHDIHIRSIQFKAMAVGKIMLIAGLLGGLAVFIFGMRMMSDSLQLVAGEKLKGILQFFTRNRFVAILAGAVVTAGIQSSSACTVMTVGFVNAGLLTLKQAVGVVMGANIGTTMTAQIISFKLNNLAYPAIAIGLIMTMVSKRKSTKYWGEVLMGFGLLFLGMTVMGRTLKPLKNSPSFIGFFKGFDCTPINGMMPVGNVLWAIFIGTIMTIAIQSSSATIGLAMALAGSGLINFYTAVPLILGDNIGTTSTAVIASLGTNKASKRTACVHFLFNVFGVLYMFALFFINYKGKPVYLYFINSITSGDIFAVKPENIERHIAMAHTFFNVLNVIVFLPFVGVLANLATQIIRKEKDEVDEDEKIVALEPHLLDTPAIAMAQTVKELSYMTSLAFKNVKRAFENFQKKDSEDQKIFKREAKVDKLQHDITDYLVQLSQRELKAKEANLLPKLLHIVNDAERVGDHALNIVELSQRIVDHKLGFSSGAQEEIQSMWKLLENQYQNLQKAFEENDSKYTMVAMEDEKRINELEAQVSQNHTARLEKNECNVSSGIVFLELTTNFEKIGDRLNNIAERLKIYIDENSK